MSMFIISFILLMASLFIVLVFSLRKILNRNVVSATTHLEQLAAEYAKKEEQIRTQLEQTQRQCKELVANAQKDAGQQREEILTKTQEEKDKILSEAQQKADEIVNQADRTRKTLLAEIEERIEDRALKRAAELIQKTLPEDVRKNIHNHRIEELIASSLQQLERLRLPEGKLEAKIVSAFELTSKQSDSLKLKLKEKLGRSIEIKEEIDSGVVAGLIVNIGSLILDGSLRFKIQEAATAKAGGK